MKKKSHERRLKIKAEGSIGPDYQTVEFLFDARIKESVYVNPFRSHKVTAR